MFYLCSQVDGYTGLVISWGDALRLPVKQRDYLIEKLSETREKEERQMKQVDKRAR